jgi:hypothetical protein
MPATPLFITDLDTLKAQLRLSALDTGDAAAVLDAVVGEVRLGFNDELGISRVAEIVALTSVEAPATEDELTRFRAENVELLWTRVILMRRLPTFFVQGSGQARKAWNEEGITGGSDDTNLRREIRSLEQQVRDGLARLESEVAGEVNATVILPDETPPRPGDSINPAVTREHEHVHGDFS